MDLDHILRSATHFAGLSDEDLASVATAFAVESYPDGHTFIRQGERGSEVFVLVEGKIAVTAQRDGVTHQIGELKPGELFGLVTLVDNDVRSATCRAAGPVRVGSLASSAAALLFNQRAPIACAFQQALALQVVRDYRRLERTLLQHLAAASG